jgi:hypothetical protein
MNLRDVDDGVGVDYLRNLRTFLMLLNSPSTSPTHVLPKYITTHITYALHHTHTHTHTFYSASATHPSTVKVFPVFESRVRAAEFRAVNYVRPATFELELQASCSLDFSSANHNLRVHGRWHYQSPLSASIQDGLSLNLSYSLVSNLNIQCWLSPSAYDTPNLMAA